MNTTAGSSSDPAEANTRTANQAREIMEAVASENKIPGMSVAIATPDRVLYAGAVGFADLAQQRPSGVEDQYPWFSMTKIATATTAMRLHVVGLLDLDAPIGEYLAGYRPHATHGHPTTRQLLAHTAGLGNPLPVRWVRLEDDPADPALLGRIIAKHGTPKRAVGGAAAYSNIGYLLAGEVIASATGLSFEVCVREQVLDRLGMEHTGFLYDREAARAVGYVRTPRAFVPVLRALLPRGLVGGRVDGHTALNPFLLNGAAFGGLVGSVTDAVQLAAAPTTPPFFPILTSRRCAPSPRPGNRSTTASAGSASRPMPNGYQASSSTTAPALATGTPCASIPNFDSHSSP